MNEPEDPREAELAAFRPREISPALRRRVADCLAGPRPGRFRRRWLPVLAGGLAAACLAAMLFPWPGRQGDDNGLRPTVTPPTPHLAADESRPVLLAYQRAWARSPEDLAALLDKHAMAAPGPRLALPQVRGYPRSNALLDTLLGED
jgi:hypothetical protein